MHFEIVVLVLSLKVNSNRSDVMEGVSQIKQVLKTLP